MANDGYKIVLTADRTLMADYPTLFDGIMGTIQTTTTPEPIMRYCLAPALRGLNGSLSRAPLGLRRIEAALLAGGFERSDIAIAAPESIHQAIGPATRVVGISSGDPLGMGMSNTTMIAMSGGELFTRRWYAALCRRLRTVRRKHGAFRVVAGGPGAWQLANDPPTTRRLGIDTVFLGYAERGAPGLFARLVAGESAGRVVQGERCGLGDIPRLRGPTSLGAVEISRGCGRGCHFCTMAREPMIHLPSEQVAADVAVNTAGGVCNLSLVTEDFLRYGASGSGVEPSTVLSLLQTIRQNRDVRMIQIDHASIASVMQFTPDELRAVRDEMVRTTPHERVWVNLGVESAAADLLASNGLGGKIAPFRTDDWADLCEQAVRRLIDAGFVPMVSLVLGLPGETPDHIAATAAFVERIADLNTMIFPIFLAPLSPEYRAFGRADMSAGHWRLFRRCYGVNFRTVPPLFWDNHRAAGAPMWRRLFIQSAGRLQTLQWKLRFALLAGRAKR